MRRHKPIQMGIFDIPRSSPPPPEPRGNHDQSLINFIEDINNKKSPQELDMWRYKHRNRINNLSNVNRFKVLNYIDKRKEMLK